MTTRRQEETAMEQSASVGTQPTAPTKAQEQLGRATDRARDQLREQVNRRSTDAGARVRSAAGDTRSVAEQLRRQGKDTPARYAEQAADRVEHMGGYLQQADGDRILRDVEDFGRRNPWAMVAGGLALGFLSSRLLKSSSAERYRSMSER
jgi:ElaB/YqjD/DUF883 family membrane-anchored ribosome-binding protein